MIKKLKPLQQVVEEGGYEKEYGGYKSRDYFYITSSMLEYFGKNIDVEFHKNGEFGALYVGPYGRGDGILWTFREDMFEPDGFFNEDDFKI